MKSPLQIFDSLNIFSYPFTSFHILQIILCHFVSFHIILCHFNSFHVISYHYLLLFLSTSLFPIWWNREKRYSFDFVRRTTSHLYHFHLHPFSWWINWGISVVRQILKQGGFISINIIQYWICADVTWHKWNLDICQDQAETSYIQYLPWSRRTCNVLWWPVLQISHALHEHGIKWLQVSYVNTQSWISHFGLSSLSAMERRKDSQQRMQPGSLPWIDSQFVGLCAEV